MLRYFKLVQVRLMGTELVHLLVEQMKLKDDYLALFRDNMGLGFYTNFHPKYACKQVDALEQNSTTLLSMLDVGSQLVVVKSLDLVMQLYLKHDEVVTLVNRSSGFHKVDQAKLFLVTPTYTRFIVTFTVASMLPLSFRPQILRIFKLASAWLHDHVAGPISADPMTFLLAPIIC